MLGMHTNLDTSKFQPGHNFPALAWVYGVFLLAGLTTNANCIWIDICGVELLTWTTFTRIFHMRMLRVFKCLVKSSDKQMTNVNWHVAYDSM